MYKVLVKFEYEQKKYIMYLVKNEIQFAYFNENKKLQTELTKKDLSVIKTVYKALCINKNTSILKIPVIVSQEKEIQNLAIKAFRAINGSGLSRVDFFLTDEGKIYINEINTMPGFTNISMYAKLWEESGIGYRELIDELINLAN